MAIAVVGGLVGIGIAYAKYIKQIQFLQKMLHQGFLKCFTINIYVDEFYDAIFVKPINFLSRFSETL
jgi:NADH-quinone oxidoreductase subunit L